jgi:Molecular chaperone
MSDSKRNGASGAAGSGNETQVIGIDLGTSTSAIAFLKDAIPELIQDDQGDRVVPSVLQYTPEKDFLVGSVAKASAITFHDRTLQEVKRLMGTDEKVKLGGLEMTPEEASAVILRHLKRAAEAKFGEGSVRDVVLSVPARFENEAREATRRAAEMAGLNVVRLINEPTAAALAYGMNRLEDRKKVLVFDFGGGTLDVTILEMYEGVLDVKTSVGDDKLGGKDVDDLLVDLFREVYKDQHGKKLPSPSKDRKIAQILKQEAEEYKKRLSSAISIPVDLPYLTPDGGINFLLTRTKLDEMLEPLLMRAMTLVNAALARARMEWKDIDVVLPVGGSSRLSLFRRALEFAWGREIREYENPDEAVAKGAAIAAGIERKRFEDEQSIMILDVSPHRLGVATIKQVGAGQFIDDYFSEIIPKDAKLPAIERRNYGTLFGNGDTVFIRVYEAASDSNLCRDHRLISQLELNRLKDAAPDELVQVEFSYTLDGTLDVSARYVSSPVVKVEGTFNLNRSEEESAAVAAAGTNGMATALNMPNGHSGGGHGGGSVAAEAAARISPKQLAALWRNSPHAEQCAPLIEQAERAEMDHPESATYIRKASDALKMALVSGTESDVRRNLDALTDVLFDLV